MSACKLDTVDFNFIMAECLRVGKRLSGDNIMEEHNLEYNGLHGGLGMMITVPARVYLKNKGGNYPQLHLSYAAHDRFFDIARRQINSKRLGSHITVSEFVSFLKDEFYIHVIIDDETDDQRGYSRLVDRTIRNAFKKMDSERFYFPMLALGLDQDIEIGSAKIVCRDTVFNMAKPFFDKSIINRADDFCDSGEFPYNHFLIVNVTKRSNKLRTRVAKNIAEFIVGIFHIFSEHYNISHEFISLSFNSLPRYNGFYFINKNKKLNYNFSSKGKVLWSDVFWSKFQSDFKDDLKDIISKLIEMALDPSRENIIADRLVDSIYMFSSSLYDKDKAFRVVKLTTALERLVSLTADKNSGITTLNFKNRVASLAAVYYGDLDKWVVIAQKMYDMRSGIVHGSSSIYRGGNEINTREYSQLAARAIISACFGFSSLGLDTPDKDKILSDFYKGLEYHFGVNTKET
ncbi:HEPN domain-containing protein [Serratia quinivorans]|uniref:HEPN domain-containing protein n=1 Tax=Serratia quinivorans TaxID=137545 RepID=UPI00217B9C62|nr:HEPN domain-containing protein [Serratia quinivorans]MDU5488242.1 HEPN domain-containing protein [Serratia liquefaciens]CAI1543461.1 Uncharacterised protein [Serratia quinivorans]